MTTMREHGAQAHLDHHAVTVGEDATKVERHITDEDRPEFRGYEPDNSLAADQVMCSVESK